MTPKRLASSARRFVASSPGTARKVKSCPPHVLRQPLVGGVALGREDRLDQRDGQPAARRRQAVVADLAGRVSVPQIESPLQQAPDAAREVDRPARRRGCPHGGP
jgi:hypothetical protein